MDVQVLDLTVNPKVLDLAVPEMSSNKGYSKRETTSEILEAKVEWFRQYVSKQLFEQDDSTLTAILKKQYAVTNSTNVEELFIIEQVIDFAKGVINGQ